MIIWLLLALMTAAAVVAVIWPLGRARGAARAGTDIAVYRDQLDEIERDLAAGEIGASEAEAARVEVSRRLLAAADAAKDGIVDGASVRPKRITAVAALVAIPVVAGGLYLSLGSPFMPGLPLAERVTAANQSITALLARAEAHLERNPEDGRGWEVVAPVYMRLERFDDAVKARRNALRLLGATPDRETDFGEALAAAANGVITADAKAAFERAVKLDARTPKARFFLGLAAEQDGQSAEAARIWRDMLAQAPADAPWAGVVRQSLARVDPSSAAPGPSSEDMAAASEMPPEQRDQMVRGMVERLATRLKEDGSDLEGWFRLMRAYMVLGERDKARAAASDARRALANEPDKLRRLDDGVKGMGLEG